MSAAIPIIRWTDQWGVKRCSHLSHSYAPRVATTIGFGDVEIIIGDVGLAKRAAERRAREGR